jgi:mono/diheme cytochrome c family protein
MRLEDIIDLKAYLDTLPAVENAVPATALAFPFNIRRGIGLWQRLYVNGETFVPDPAASAAVNRGAYLTEGPGHCTQCHSPRGFDGGIIADRAYSGAPLAGGAGNAPNITTDTESGIGTWSVTDIVGMMKTGFLPDFDVVGGDMTEVQRNLARLTPDDQTAMAEYLKTLPAIPSQYKATQAGGSAFD